MNVWRFAKRLFCRATYMIFRPTTFTGDSSNAAELIDIGCQAEQFGLVVLPAPYLEFIHGEKHGREHSVLRLVFPRTITELARHAQLLWLIPASPIVYPTQTYTLCLKKQLTHLICDHKFNKCRPTFKILQLLSSKGNSAHTCYKDFPPHLNSNVLLTYYLPCET